MVRDGKWRFISIDIVAMDEDARVRKSARAKLVDDDFYVTAAEYNDLTC